MRGYHAGLFGGALASAAAVAVRPMLAQQMQTHMPPGDCQPVPKTVPYIPPVSVSCPFTSRSNGAV